MFLFFYFNLILNLFVIINILIFRNLEGDCIYINVCRKFDVRVRKRNIEKVYNVFFFVYLIAI